MDLSKILAISGKPGLFRMVTQSKSNIIVESFVDKKRFPVYFSSQNISSLEEISIYTMDDDVPLKKVFQNIFKELDGEMAPSHKSDTKTLTEFMEKVLPDYDKDRVYISNIKKLVSWYNFLNEYKLIDLEENKETKEEPQEKEATDNE